MAKYKIKTANKKFKKLPIHKNKYLFYITVTHIG